MIDAAFAAAGQIFTRPYRIVFWKSLGLTLLLLVFCAAGLNHILGLWLTSAWSMLPAAWLSSLLTSLLHWAAGFGLLAAVAFLVTPVSFVVAGFYFDELALHAEDAIAGPESRGRPLPLAPALWLGLKFANLSLAVNALALVLLLVPGINAIAFFGANAYLLGRGYFELAALRHCSFAETTALRQAHQVPIFCAGCFCAGLLAVPVANLLTPLFASAFLVRIASPIIREGRRAHAMR